MRTLTNFEITAIAGGFVIPIKPIDSDSKEAVVLLGMTGGFLGGLTGLVLGLQSNYSLQGAALCAVTGFSVAAFGFPMAFIGFAKGMEYCYEQLGMI